LTKRALHKPYAQFVCKARWEVSVGFGFGESIGRGPGKEQCWSADNTTGAVSNRIRKKNGKTHQRFLFELSRPLFDVHQAGLEIFKSHTKVQ